MLNLFDRDGRKLTSIEENKGRLIAPRAQRAAREMGATKVIPFSSFHCYQRTDSVWANDLVPELLDYQTGALSGWPEMLPAFIRVNCETDEITQIAPKRLHRVLRAPEEFGDSWSDPLVAEDKSKIRKYFMARASLHNHFGFIEVTVGGSNVTVDLNRRKRDIGITFECPRQSLMTGIDYEVFDDLLIGNFMRTTLHNVDGLYPHFSPYVAKYADNGGAKSRSDLMAYFGHYYLRDPIAHSLKMLSDSSEMVIRQMLGNDTWRFKKAKALYYDVAARSSKARMRSARAGT